MLGFFHEEERAKPGVKQAPMKRGSGRHIPIETMRSMGCAACPSDKDGSLQHPKMEAEGKQRARVYILLSAPSSDEDATGHWADDKAGDALYKALQDAGYDRKVRFNATVRCFQSKAENWQRPDIGPTECCRGFIERDIEDCAPDVVIGIGDAALNWATGLDANVLPFRGTPIATRIGKHACYYMPVAYPNFAFSSKDKKPEWKLTFFADIQAALDLADSGPEAPQVADPSEYDKGISYITGSEPGDMQRLEEAMHRMLRYRDTALDWETNGLRPYLLSDPRIWLAAIGTFEDTVAFCVDHPEGWGTESRQKRVKGLLGDYLMQARKIAHNVAFEQEWANYFWGALPLRLTDWEDTMALAHTLNERPGTKGLNEQTRIYFGFQLKKQNPVDPVRLLEYPLLGKGGSMRYNGMDSKWTHRLFHHVRPIVARLPATDWEYERKVRLSPTLVLTMEKGAPVDVGYAEDMQAELEKKLEAVDKRILRCPEVQQFERAHGTFRLGNDKDMLQMLKDMQRPEIQTQNRDGSTRWSTDEETLAQLPADEVPSAKLTLERRGLSKIKGTYIDPVVERRVVCADGRMRTVYNSMKAETGRLASEEPNFQNWPKRKHKEVRGVIYAPDGYWLVALDYGQIEARVFGMATEDPVLVKYLWTGYDIHGFWADYFIRRRPDWQDYIAAEYSIDRGDAKALRKEARQICKNGWVFPQFFGSATRSCAENMHLDEDVAEDAAAQFWDEFKGVKKWQDKLLRDYQKKLRVDTLTGRPRRGPLTPNQILNHPIQGTAADIVTDAMDRLSVLSFVENDPELQPAWNVHDDLGTLMRDEGMAAKIKRMAEVMCTPTFDFINVPLIVEASIGARWHEMEEIAVYRSNELFNIPNPYAEVA